MKGIIFNLFEGFVVSTFGDARYEQVLAAAALQTTEPFVGPGSYPDEDLRALLVTTAEQTAQPVEELLRGFGRLCIPGFAKRFPGFFPKEGDPRSFFRSVGRIHRIEVGKFFNGATPPSFEVRELDGQRMRLRYSSSRGLCPLVEGLIHGVLGFYGTTTEVREVQCVADGADVCEFEVALGASEATT